MEFIRIETITKDGKKFSSEIETESLYKLNCASGKIIEMPDKITDVCVSDGILLIRTQDRDFRDGRQTAPIIKDDRQENNINAFDCQGNHLWNIGEIVGDIKMQFDGITHLSLEEAKNQYGISCKTTSNLFKCISGGFVFIIDANDKKLLLKVSGGAK